MRMSKYDRCMAIKRHPEFIEEYEEYIKLKCLTQPMCEDTEQSIEKSIEIWEKWGVSVEEIEHAEEMSKEAHDCIMVVTTIENTPMSIIDDGSSYKIIATKETPDGSLTFGIRGGGPVKKKVVGNKLYLEVDIYDTISNLKEEFDRTIRKYKAMLPEDKSRDKELNVDHWKVYDMANNENLNPHQIAKDNSGIKDNASHNKKLESWDKAVRNALNRATRMVEYVGEQAKKRA